jgi:hypothetical protein
MAIINRAQLLKELEPGLHALFGMEYKKYENQHSEIYESNSSDRAFEEEVLITGFGGAVAKAEGQGITYDTAAESWTARYAHTTYALGFALTEEAIDDNLYGSLSKRYTKALARSMAHTKQVNAAAILNNGFTGSVGGDGKSLFATDHPLWSGGTYSNRVSADISETALENAIIAIQDFVDDRGLPIALQATKLIIPNELTFVVERLLKTEYRPGSADNDINAVVSTGVIKGGYRVNNFLTDPDAWFIATDCPDGMKMFTRKALKTAMEGDFETGNVRFKASERYSFGYSNPRAMYGSPGV